VSDTIMLAECSVCEESTEDFLAFEFKSGKHVKDVYVFCQVHWSEFVESLDLPTAEIVMGGMAEGTKRIKITHSE
jgi:hypothetical protein